MQGRTQDRPTAAKGTFPYPHISMTWPQFCRSECMFEGRHVRLMPRTAKVLFALLARRGEIVSKAALVDFVYPDPDNSPDWEENCICRFVRLLRERLPGLILTEGKQGWMILRPSQPRAMFAPPHTFARIADIDHCGRKAA